MYQVQNSEVADHLRSHTKLDILQMPSVGIENKVVPTLDVTPVPEIKVVQNASSSSSATGTIFTTSATKKTYILAIQYNMVKDATCDIATGIASVRTTINGVSGQVLGSVYNLTLTAQNQGYSIVLPYPLLVDKAVAVQFAQATFTAGTFARTATIYYYETD